MLPVLYRFAHPEDDYVCNRNGSCVAPAEKILFMIRNHISFCDIQDYDYTVTALLGFERLMETGVRSSSTCPKVFDHDQEAVLGP
jgi:hypothetical protein